MMASRNKPSFCLHFECLEEGRFVATSPEVPGLVVEGCTMDEVMELAPAVARQIAQSCVHHGDPLPAVFGKSCEWKDE